MGPVTMHSQRMRTWMSNPVKVYETPHTSVGAPASALLLLYSEPDVLGQARE